MIAKTIIIAVDSPAGSQRAKHVIMHSRMLRMSVLTLPIISATRPASQRPKKDPAFSMARIWKPKDELWPWDVDQDDMNVNGMNMPHSMRKIPRLTSAKGGSLKTERSGATDLKLHIGLRGSLLLTSKFAIPSRAARMNPRILVAHANPRAGMSLCSMSGKTMPPIEPLVMAIPVAFPRLRRKKCPMDEMQGVLRKAPPRPFRTL